MKICFIAPGEISIPPSGWGALETVVWNQSFHLNSLGVETLIINESCPQITLQKIKNFNPDIVHLHYGKHWQIMPLLSCRKIVTNHDGSFKNSAIFHDNVVRKSLYDCEFFCLSEYEKNFFRSIGISPKKIKIMRNGVEFNKFKKNPAPIYNETICIGRIDSRKQQSFLQKSKLKINFVGSVNCSDFDSHSLNYLGEWNRQEIFNQITNYSNFILLSSSENCCPLVCLEAMSSGLGIVISEACTESIDLSLPFISVIPNDKIHNVEYISEVIQTNKEYSITHRHEIIDYAEKRSWSNIAKEYLSNL
jgi:glycosyltransferase involved in cell wall biosynthesis